MYKYLKSIMKEKMIALLAMLVILSCSPDIRAQVTIGSGEVPNEGALLDLKESGKTTKGLGIPRVKLQKLLPSEGGDLSNTVIEKNSTDNTNVLNEGWGNDVHIGLVVYNVANKNIEENVYTCPGMHVWNGSAWQPLSPTYTIERHGGGSEPQVTVNTTVKDLVFLDPNDVTYTSNKDGKGIEVWKQLTGIDATTSAGKAKIASDYKLGHTNSIMDSRQTPYSNPPNGTVENRQYYYTRYYVGASTTITTVTTTTVSNKMVCIESGSNAVPEYNIGVLTSEENLGGGDTETHTEVETVTALEEGIWMNQNVNAITYDTNSPYHGTEMNKPLEHPTLGKTAWYPVTGYDKRSWVYTDNGKNIATNNSIGYGLHYSMAAALGDAKHATTDSIIVLDSSPTFEILVRKPEVQGICPNGWHVPANSEWMDVLNVHYWKKGIFTGGALANVSNADWPLYPNGRGSLDRYDYAALLDYKFISHYNRAPALSSKYIMSGMSPKEPGKSLEPSKGGLYLLANGYYVPGSGIHNTNYSYFEETALLWSSSYSSSYDNSTGTVNRENTVWVGGVDISYGDGRIYTRESREGLYPVRCKMDQAEVQRRRANGTL